MRGSLIFYRSFYEAIKELPRDVQGEIYTAIMEYSLYGSETEQLKPIARSIFSLIKPQLDANNKRYENGKKGGRPVVKETEQKPNTNQTLTKPKPNENVNENVNENEKEQKRDTDVSPESPDSFRPLNPDPKKETHPPVAPPPLPNPDFEKFQKWIGEGAQSSEDGRAIH